MRINQEFKNLKIIFYYIIFMILLIIAGFRDIGFDRDSTFYVEYILSITSHDYTKYEPSFWFMYDINKYIFNDIYIRMIFISYAFLGISLKIYAIQKMSIYPLFSIFVYVSLLFVLLEMTQIRFSIAAAIFLLSVEDIKNRNFTNYVLKSFLAIMFHYSALIMIFFYFINPKEFDKKFYFLLPFVGIIFSMMSTFAPELIENNLDVFPEFISSKLEIYLIYSQVNNINIFSSYQITILLIYLFSIVNIYKFKSSYDFVIIKLMGWSLFLFYMLSFMPSFSFRLSSLIGIVVIIFLGNVISIFKHKNIAILFMGLYILLMAINKIFIHGLLNFDYNYVYYPYT